MFGTQLLHMTDNKRMDLYMRKLNFFNLLSIFLVLLMLSGTFAITAYASSIDSFLVDSSTRWTNYSNGLTIHRGSKNSTYQYSSSSVKSTYSAYVTNGIGLWGSYISCTESSSSPIGTITVSAMDSDANATLAPSYSPSTMHISSWTLTIYSNNFDGNTDAGKYRTIAHEIGHAYGLGHVNYSSQIMYHTYSESKNVTSYDKAGMNVMTHAHTHTGSYSTTLEQYSTYSHKVRCSTCKAYSLDNCSSTNYHSGSTHYFVFNCSCGNHNTQSWACSGNPCIMPFYF